MQREILPGDIVLFVRPTLKRALASGWRGIPAWLSGVVTAAAQRVLCGTPQGHDNGFYDYTHCAIVTEADGEKYLLQAAPPRGVTLTPLEAALNASDVPVHIAPLNDAHRALWDEQLVCQWIEQHLGKPYYWGGVPGAVFNGWLGGWLKHLFRSLLMLLFGYDPDDALFCSQLVARLLQHVNEILPKQLTGLRRGRLAQGCAIRADAYAPAEVADLAQIKRRDMWEYKI